MGAAYTGAPQIYTNVWSEDATKPLRLDESAIIHHILGEKNIWGLSVWYTRRSQCLRKKDGLKQGGGGCRGAGVPETARRLI